MSNLKNKKDIVSLIRIEKLSKKISDLVYSGSYNKIDEINKLRLELIKKFKDKSNKNFRIMISNINQKNINNIKQIESDFNKLKTERSKFIKRFKAYNN